MRREPRRSKGYSINCSAQAAALAATGRRNGHSAQATAQAAAAAGSSTGHSAQATALAAALAALLAAARTF